MKISKIFAYGLAAAAGMGLIWVPDEMFYEHPELFFAIYA